MLSNIYEFLSEMFENHRGRKIGFLVGIVIGISFLTLGFFSTMFLMICGTAGLYVGAKLDDQDELIDDTITFLDRILPDKFQRW